MPSIFRIAMPKTMFLKVLSILLRLNLPCYAGVEGSNHAHAYMSLQNHYSSFVSSDDPSQEGGASFATAKPHLQSRPPIGELQYGALSTGSAGSSSVGDRLFRDTFANFSASSACFGRISIHSLRYPAKVPYPRSSCGRIVTAVSCPPRASCAPRW